MSKYEEQAKNITKPNPQVAPKLQTALMAHSKATTKKVDQMKLDELIRQLRQLVLEHPKVAREEVVLYPHGPAHNQALVTVRLNDHGTKIVLEAER